MNPSIQFKSDESGVFKFTLSGVNVCFANAIRRTILSDIKTICINTDKGCTIDINNSRLHNEILKERLKCIPVHIKDLDRFAEKYYMELDVKNETENILYITTQDFKIKNRETKREIEEKHRESIFPKNILTGFYIDFARLGAFVDETIEMEHLKLRADFSVVSSKENGSYSVVSICTFENKKDTEKIMNVWKTKEKALLREIAGVDEISQVNTDKKKEVVERLKFEERDFMYLDAQRHFVKNSFDFTIESIGVYTNQEILSKSIVILQNLFFDFKKDIEADTYTINRSSFNQEHPSTMENSFDVIIENMDYTFGNIISFILYEKFYVEKQILSYCGFRKFHPHDNHSILRIAFIEKVDLEDVKSKLMEASNIAKDVFTKLHGMVKI
jgi:DNA-directed RNA polymerase alpha subunit/DNA-directed RNA polymerase subunit L